MADQTGYTMYFEGHWKSIAQGDNGDSLFLTAGVPDWRPITAGDVASGTFADDRISQSSVTQHEGSINHDNLTGFVSEEHIRWDQTGAEDVHVDRIPDLSGTYAAASHVHAAGDVTSGTFADDRISQSSVTQHEGAITHDNLAGFVANEHLDWTGDQGATDIHAGNIPDLSGTYQPLDGDLTALAAIGGVGGDVLYYDSGWKALAKGSNGEVMKLSAGLPVWQAEGGGTSHDLLSATHTDVAATAVARGSVIRGNSSPAWEQYTVGANLDVLATDGTDSLWVQLTAGHTQSGTFADDRISQSSVTQHEGAITHDNLAGFVANEHLDWTGDQGATDIHAGNIPDLSGAYDPAGTAASAVGTHESTYNHANYNTAYGWGDHAGLYEATGAVGTHESTYSHANYNTAYGWGDHAGLYEATGAVSTHESTYNHGNYNTAYGWGDHSGLYQPLDGDLTAIAAIGGVNGDVLYYNSGWKALAKGTDTEVLTLQAGLPQWVAAGASSATWESTGGLFQAKASAVAAGDYIYARSRDGDSAAALGVVVDTENAFSTAGAKLLSVRNNGVEKASIDKDGDIDSADIRATGTVTASGSNGFMLAGTTYRMVKSGTTIVFRVNNSNILAFNKGSGIDMMYSGANQIRATHTGSPRVRVNCSTAITSDNEHWFTVEDNGTARFALERVDAILGSVDTALMLGGYYLWVDTDGKLRIKNSVPTTDTDGDLVGTQTI